MHAEPGGEYPSSVYYDSDHKANLLNMARGILEERPCITEKALALEIALRHGLSRTSKKQISHLRTVLGRKMGVLRLRSKDPVYWARQEDVEKIQAWRGLNCGGISATGRR